MNAYLTLRNADHHTAQRKLAIRALEGKIDELDGQPTWAEVFWVCAVVAIVTASVYITINGSP